MSQSPTRADSAYLSHNLLYNESIYLVSNYSGVSQSGTESLSVDELLSRDIAGFYFYLKRDTATNLLLLRNPNGSYSPFGEALRSIRKAMEANRMKVMTLFLDFYVDMELDQAFEEARLSDYLLRYDSEKSWPAVSEMVESGQRLVVFELQKHLRDRDWLHDANDFVAFADTGWESDTNKLETFDERLRKNLFLFSGYRYLNSFNNNDENITTFARQSPYLIESIKRAWISEGKVPNFILINKYYSWFSGLLLTLRNFNIIHGTVTYNNELVNYVNWQGLSNYTGGKFYFPLEPGAKLTLTPSCPGYRAMPTGVEVVSEHKKIMTRDFEVRPLDIEEGLELFLPFDNTTEDLSFNSNDGANKGVEFVYDPIRGSVASFGQQGRIDLPGADALHVRDHDFTVGVWLKIPRYMEDKSDYCILGTNNNIYQQAIHFLIRNKKPYMGFFNNDLEGNTVIEPGKWYNVIWRYNKSNGEQAIFVNGKLDAITFDRPAYLGSDSLYVGYVNFSQNSSFLGVMDNLCIWSRVLSDKEILGLNNQLVDFNPSWWTKKGLSLLYPFIIALLLSVLMAYLVRKYRKRQSVKPMNPINPIIPVEANGDEKEAEMDSAENADLTANEGMVELPDRNLIRFFGDFFVLDRDGNDITTLFTPRLKQLFIIIMLYSYERGSGISGSELSEYIWGDNPVKSTKSLRSVSILKLRKILERLDCAEIVFSSNKYAIIFGQKVYCDYLVCLDLLRKKQVRNKGDFERFYEIVNRGEVFKDESFAWLDDFKGYICNSVVDVLLKHISAYSLSTDSDKVIQIADQVLLNDPSNEEAIAYKVRALVSQDNLRSARYVYEKFSLLYNEMYGEVFPVSFERMIADRPVNQLS